MGDTTLLHEHEDTARVPWAKAAGHPKGAKAKAKAKIRIGSVKEVFYGTAMMTKGGLCRKHLMFNKRGKIVSKKASKAASHRFATTDTTFKAVHLALAKERVQIKRSTPSAGKFILVGGKTCTETSLRLLNAARSESEWRMGYVATRHPPSSAASPIKMEDVSNDP